MGCCYHHLITQPTCSPPSNTGDFLLIGQCSCWCGKAAPNSTHIFCHLLMTFGNWKWEGVTSTMTLTSRKKIAVGNPQRTLAQSSAGQKVSIYFLGCFSKGKALWEKNPLSTEKQKSFRENGVMRFTYAFLKEVSSGDIFLAPWEIQMHSCILLG